MIRTNHIDQTVLAYLAGAIDADGAITIKRSTYHMRIRGDATQPTFSERMHLRQVTPQVPELLRATFGGGLRLHKGQTIKSRPLYSWDASDRIAADAARLLLPFLRIKRDQAQCLVSLRETKDRTEMHQISYWFQLEHPDWTQMPMVTFSEAAERLGLKGIETVSQAVRNRSIPALARDRSAPGSPRIPALFIDLYREHMARSSDNRGRTKPPQLMALRESLWRRCRGMNQIGNGDHPINLNTGPYAPL